MWWLGTVPAEWQTGLVVPIYKKKKRGGRDQRMGSSNRDITLLHGKDHSRFSNRRGTEVYSHKAKVTLYNNHVLLLFYFLLHKKGEINH